MRFSLQKNHVEKGFRSGFIQGVQVFWRCQYYIFQQKNMNQFLRLLAIKCQNEFVDQLSNRRTRRPARDRVTDDQILKRHFAL